MGEQHLDFLPTATGLHVFGSGSVRTSYVAGVFMQIPRDLAGKSVRATLGFEFADVAIQFAGAIEPCALGCDATSGNGEGAVGSVGLVEDRNERRDSFLFDEPGQALR